MPFSSFLTDVVTIFLFVLWLWLLITVAGDLFRRDDVSGWGKALWIVVLIIIPYIAVLAYLITQGRGMAQRSARRAEDAREEVRRFVGFSVADEIGKLETLKKSGSITEAEYAKLRAKLIQ